MPNIVFSSKKVEDWQQKKPPRVFSYKASSYNFTIRINLDQCALFF